MQPQTVDADLVAFASYFDELETTLTAASPYIQQTDKAADVFGALTTRECELLYKYNKKLLNTSAVFVDDVRVADSYKNRFLAAWGLSDDVAAGVADDPCGNLEY